MNDEITLEKQLANLRTQHKTLDSRIGDLIRFPSADQLRLARLKRQKLNLRDQIIQIEEFIYPDIIA